MKLNTDGVVFGNPIQVGEGGVIWDSNGEWVAGFVRKLGSMSSVLAKLWALKDGLLLARQLDIINVNIEFDADLIVHLLNNLSSHNLMLEPLLNDCRNLIKTFTNCTVAHIFREANRCANKLANMGATQAVNFLLLYEPPPVVVDLLAFDKTELFCNKMLVI
nr:putative ribonuclease h protein [Quercus suber]